MPHVSYIHRFFEILQPFLGWLALVSLITFCLSLIFIPWLVGRIPQDYFTRFNPGKNDISQITLSSIIIAVARNCLGIFLILAGILMLFLPGQGILTILLGSLLVSFPGKGKVVSHLVANVAIQKSMDWLRLKRDKEKFTWPK